MNALPDQQPNPFPTEILASMFAEPEPTEVIAEYVWGARPGHRDDLVRRDRYEDGEPVERLYCLMDYFNPVAVIDAAGEVQERYAWSAFGLRRILDPAWESREESALAFEFGFHGQFLDGEAGWYNYGFRYYSPEIGRWLSKDPIGEHGGVNLYGFTGNNPVANYDRFGLEFKLEQMVLPPDPRYMAVTITKLIVDGLDEDFFVDAKVTRGANDEIEEVGENCARVKMAAQIDMRVILQLHQAGTQVGTFYTENGESEVIAHELRRVSLAHATYKAFFVDVQKSRHHVTKCGCVCLGSFEEAKNALTRYLDALRQEAHDAAKAYWRPENRAILDEHNHYIRVGGLFDRFGTPHTVNMAPSFSPSVQCP